MNKYIIILTTFFLLNFYSNSSFGQDKIQILSDNKESKNIYGINEFFFVHQIFADAFFMTDLYKQLDYDEMHKIIKELLFKIDTKNKVTVLIQQKDKPVGKLVFSMIEKSKDGTLLAMSTNFETKSRAFTKEADEKNSLARWYFIKGDKLVYRKDLYSIEEEKKKIENKDKRGLIEDYMFDDNFENDSKVKGLIDEILNDLNSSKLDILYARLYLEEYYLLNSKMENAEQELKKLKDYFEQNKGNGISANYSLITKMAETEFELMKRMKYN